MTRAPMAPGASAEAAATAFAENLRDVLDWHFSEETGTPFWLRHARARGIDPRVEVTGLEHFLRVFEPLDASALTGAPLEDFIPRGYADQPPRVFETGGTTGPPVRRPSWTDHAVDYDALSRVLPPDAFPAGGAWLLLGPSGPRRLPSGIVRLAELRGAACFAVDLDPRWARRLITAGDVAGARAYEAHVLDQAEEILARESITSLFATPRLLESLGERRSLADDGLRGVLCGGTTLGPQTVRFLVEETLAGQVPLVPVYGNTLMGLAPADPIGPDTGYRVVYRPPWPRALVRVVGPDGDEVAVGERGRVELTTLTREFFLPRLLERDLATRVGPSADCPWDGLAEVGPIPDPEGEVREGVY